MRNQSRARSCFREEDARDLARNLKKYALTLSEGEKYILYEMLLRAMEPLDRFHYLRASDLLSPEEETTLHSLEKGSRRG
jgi:hypothetical protein